MEWQMRNWYYFTWLSRRPHRRAARPQHRRRQLGDEGAPGQGRSAWAAGRCAPTGSTATSSTTSPIDFEYPNGVHDDEHVPVVGTKGTCRVNDYKINGASAWDGGEGAAESTPTCRSTPT